NEKLRRLNERLLREHSQARAKGHSRIRFDLKLPAEFSREHSLAKFHPAKGERNEQSVNRAFAARVRAPTHLRPKIQKHHDEPHCSEKIPAEHATGRSAQEVDRFFKKIEGR